MAVKVNKRSRPRANTMLPFTVRLNPGDSGNLMSRLLKGALVITDTPLPQVDDERLNMWLNMINAKLDYLISHAFPRQENVEFMTFEPLSISAGGMNLITGETFNIGDVLEIKMVIQVYPSKIIYLYGEVVRIENVRGETEKYIVAVKFLGMNEAVLKEITKFDFKKHRERLMAGQ